MANQILGIIIPKKTQQPSISIVINGHCAACTYRMYNNLKISTYLINFRYCIISLQTSSWCFFLQLTKGLWIYPHFNRVRTMWFHATNRAQIMLKSWILVWNCTATLRLLKGPTQRFCLNAGVECQCPMEHKSHK